MDFLIAQLQRIGLSPDLVFMVVVFGAVVLFVFAAVGLFTGRDPVTQRLEAKADGRRTMGPSLRYQPSDSWLTRVLAPISRAATPTKEEEISATRLRMMQAGYMNPGAAGTYYAVRGALCLVFPAVVLLFLPVFAGNLEPATTILVVLVSAATGFYCPYLYVVQKTQKRQQAAQEGFPDALDMLLVCVEAGLSLGAAIDRVAKELGRAHPVLAEQFGLVGVEINTGKTRETALRNMAARLGIDEVRSLVTLLLQSEALGTSIAQTLRIHAQEMRQKRLIRAEEKGNKLPVKIAIPLVIFILPSLMTVVMTPLIIRIFRTMLSP